MTSALNTSNPCKQQLSVKEIMIATTSSGIYRESELSEKYMPSNDLKIIVCPFSLSMDCLFLDLWFLIIPLESSSFL
jgi:hypothetical protein